MGKAIVQIKVMPRSPSSDLDIIEREIEKILSKKTSQIKKEREPIAFGLNAIKVFFVCDENDSTDELLNKIKKIKEIGSAEIADIRRTIG